MVWMCVGAYLGVGLVIALVVALWGAAATDDAAKGAGPLFRIAILPGSALLWPYMILRLLSFRRINRPIPGREPH